MNPKPDITTSLDDERLRQARRRVGKKIGWFVHLTVYVLVNAGLWLLAEIGGKDHWNLWTLFGWGIGLTAHGVAVFLSLNTEGLRERMVAEEVRRLERRGAGR